MNRLVSYTKRVTTISDFDGDIKLQQPLKFERGSNRKIRIVEASITSNLPNITTENATFAISNDGGGTWNDYTMSVGIYTISLINLAIQDAIEQEGWNTDDSDPVFILRYNTATTQAYIEIDNSKMGAGTFMIDFNYNGSLLYEVLGFEAATTYGTSCGAVTFAKVNWQGDTVCVNIEGFGPISFLNGAASTEICRIPMDLVSNSGNTYRYPSQGVVSPEVSVICGNEIYNIGIKFRTEDGEQIQAFDGTVYILLQISEY